MTETKLSRKDWNNNEPTDTDLWLKIYKQDDNLPYATDIGHLVNVIDELIYRDAETVRKAIKYLKTTPAVTLVGKGGAYELLEAYAQHLEDGTQ